MRLADVRVRWRDLPLRSKGFVVIAIPVMPLLLMGGLFYVSQRHAEEADTWVTHTLRVKEALGHSRALLVEAELGARGYLLTRDAEPLAAFRNADAALPASLEALRTLVSDNPEQLARVRLMATHVEGRPLSSIIDHANAMTIGSSMPIDLLARSRLAASRVREDLSRLEDAEDVLLESRAMRARNARRQSLSVALLGVVTGLLGGVAAALLFTTTIARRIDDATRNAQRLAIGDAVLPMTAAQDEVGMLAGAIERASVLLRERDEELQRRLRDVASANKELEAFSYSVSHDLRAPLRHIAGFASLLEKRVGDRFDAESTRYMQTIRDAAARMGRLVDDLLGFSRMGRAEMLHAFVNLDDVVREVVAEQSQDTAGRRIEWNTHALPTVRGDRALLRVALSNLVSNAIKYTGTRPVAKIEIGAEPPINGERILYVRDNGVGFDMAYGDKLFGVFQRLHAAEEFEGTGIGLANVRRIVQRHGGRTWAEGAVGRGATFFISLPA